MRVACAEAEGDAAAGLLEHDALGPGLPRAGQRPVVQAQVLHATAAAPAAAVAEIRLRRAEVVPVGLRLDALTLNGDRLPLDVKQPLDAVLGLLVASLAEVLVADAAVHVDEVERGPVVVGEF